jgi:ribosome maturation factor RimP
MGFFVYRDGLYAHFLYLAGKMAKLDPALHERFKTIVESMGYELVGCEVQSNTGQMLFRIYIDSKTGVNADDCSKVSRQIGAMMDVEDLIQGRYVLEVSSPGIDRPLFELEDYRRFIGSRAKVRLVLPIDASRKYSGLIKGVEGETVYLLLDNTEQPIALPFSNIEKGNLIGEVHFG